MALSKSKKNEVLSHLVENFKKAQSIWFAQTNGLTVAEFSELRKWLREVSATYTVSKKTLIQKALKEALDMELDLSMIPGQIWVVCSFEDSIAGLSKTNDFIKSKEDKKAEVQKISWAASVFEWKINGLEETKEIAAMPSRETLLSRLVGSMMSPLSGMARFFDAAAKEVESQGKTKVGELEVKKEEEKSE